MLVWSVSVRPWARPWGLKCGWGASDNWMDQTYVCTSVASWNRTPVMINRILFLRHKPVRTETTWRRWQPQDSGGWKADKCQLTQENWTPSPRTLKRGGTRWHWEPMEVGVKVELGTVAESLFKSQLNPHVLPVLYNWAMSHPQPWQNPEV